MHGVQKGNWFYMPRSSGDIMKKAKRDEKRVRAYQEILHDVHWRFQTYKELDPK
jgi:hypothetical protein